MDKRHIRRQSFLGERVGIISLGCARNIVDSEKILSDMKTHGARICSMAQASTVVVNTCAFTQEAKEESLGVILDLLDLKKKGKIKKIFVHGCLSARYPQELRENFWDIDAFYGVADFKTSFQESAQLTPRHLAYVKISEGCKHSCSYCAIPRIKGTLRSRKEESILEEVKVLEDRGIQELNIIGQDITSYGLDFFRPADVSTKTLPLAKLLKKILKLTSIPWIRLLYLHPRRITDDFLELIARERRICPYVDLPLQHINDRILKLMNRKITKREIVRLIENIRCRIPGATLRTTVMVGFPSETEKEFQELLDFVKATLFEKLGAFVYSREEGTEAYALKNQIDEREKQRRYQALMSLQKDISRQIQKKALGKVMEVLVEEDKGSDGIFIGRRPSDAPDVDGVVFLKSKQKLKLGSFVSARVVDTYEYDVVAEVLS